MGKKKEKAAYPNAQWTRLVDIIADKTYTVGYEGVFSNGTADENKVDAWTTAKFLENSGVTRNIRTNKKEFRTPEHDGDIYTIKLRCTVKPTDKKPEYTGDHLKRFKGKTEKRIDFDAMPVRNIKSRKVIHPEPPIPEKLTEALIISDSKTQTPGYNALPENEAYNLVQGFSWIQPDYPGQKRDSGFTAQVMGAQQVTQAAIYLKEKGWIDEQQYQYLIVSENNYNAEKKRIENEQPQGLETEVEPFCITIRIEKDPNTMPAPIDTWVARVTEEPKETGHAKREEEKKKEKKGGKKKGDGGPSLFD